jgi:hypothetical protein
MSTPGGRARFQLALLPREPDRTAEILTRGGRSMVPANVSPAARGERRDQRRARSSGHPAVFIGSNDAPRIGERAGTAFADPSER